MRIITFNIHSWRTIDGRPNLNGVIDTLAASDADIIGLNEVHHPRVVEGDSRPALEALAARLGMHFVFGPCLRWPAQNDMPAGAYGNALLARWPIIASACHHLTPKDEDAHNLLTDKELRGLLEGRILLPDKRTFTAYVTHLDHTSEDARLVQLRVARTWLVRDRSRPHVLMGDFNAFSMWDFAGRQHELALLEERQQRRDRSHHGVGEQGPRLISQVEKAGYVDLYRRVGTPGQSTYLATPEPPIRIDYIFASQPLATLATTCTIITNADGVSDHRPVLAEFEFSW